MEKVGLTNPEQQMQEPEKAGGKEEVNEEINDAHGFNRKELFINNESSISNSSNGSSLKS